MQVIGYMSPNALSAEKKEFLRIRLREFISSLPEIQRILWERGELPALINPETGEVLIDWEHRDLLMNKRGKNDGE